MEALLLDLMGTETYLYEGIWDHNKWLNKMIFQTVISNISKHFFVSYTYFFMKKIS